MIEIEKQRIFSEFITEDAKTKVNTLMNTVDRYSSREHLARAFRIFAKIWLAENNFSFASLNPWAIYEDKPNEQIFIDQITGQKYFYKGNLYNDLITRFTDYIFGD